jgi:hypothetical protein
MATYHQFSTIETLIIDHHCTFDDLAYLTSYTLKHPSLMMTSAIPFICTSIIENSFSYEIDYCISFRKRWYDNTEDRIVKSTKLIIYDQFDLMMKNR